MYNRSLFLWISSILYEGYSFRQVACLYLCFLAGGREGVPLYVLGVFSRWRQLSKLGLGSGCSGPFGCPVGFVRLSVCGSTIVLEGIV